MTDLISELQWRAEAALSKSDILLKRLSLTAIVLMAFVLRIINFVRMRGRYEFEDIFNLGWNEDLSSGSGVINFFKDSSETSTYPGLSYIVCSSQTLLGFIGIPLAAEAIFTLLGPFFASLTALVTYHLGRHLKDDFTGLLAAAMVAIIPGFYGVSADGRAANVVVGTFAVSLTILFFLKSLRSGSPIFAVLAGVSYAFVGSVWSGYIFMLYVASAYVVLMILLGRVGEKSSNIYNSFTLFYLVGTGLSVLLPAFGFQGFLYLEQFPGIAVFVLLQIAKNVDGTGKLIAPIGGVFVIAFVATSVLGILTPSIAFYSFLNQITSGNGANWVSFYRDLHLVLFLFPAGIVFCFRKKNDSNLFFVVYGLTGVALSSFSTHYTPLLCPVACSLAAFSVTSVIRTYYKHQGSSMKKRMSTKPVTKEIGFAVICGVAIVVLLFFVYSYGAAGHPAVYRPSTAIAIVSKSTNDVGWMDDFREAHSWIRHNTEKEAKMLSWKGLGHKLVSFSRDSYLGNNLDLPKNLGSAAGIFKSKEDEAADELAEKGVEYVVIVFGGSCGFRDDDLNHVSEIVPDGQFEAFESVLYKLSYSGFSDVYSRVTGQMGFDVTRRQQISFRPSLTRFQEVFSSEHWVVRIYKVLPGAPQEAEVDVEGEAVDAVEGNIDVQE